LAADFERIQTNIEEKVLLMGEAFLSPWKKHSLNFNDVAWLSLSDV